MTARIADARRTRLSMIETKRLRCEPLTVAHADEMYPVLVDETMYAHVPEKPPSSVAALRTRYEFLRAGRSPDGGERWLNWVLRLRETSELIGFYQATVRPSTCSIGFVLNPTYWGRGYATEAGLAILTRLFESLGVATVTAEIDPRNSASIRLVRRLGFSFARHDERANDDIFELTQSDWVGRHDAR